MKVCNTNFVPLGFRTGFCALFLFLKGVQVSDYVKWPLLVQSSKVKPPLQCTVAQRQNPTESYDFLILMLSWVIVRVRLVLFICKNHTKEGQVKMVSHAITISLSMITIMSLRVKCKKSLQVMKSQRSKSLHEAEDLVAPSLFTIFTTAPS